MRNETDTADFSGVAASIHHIGWVLPAFSSIRIEHKLLCKFARISSSVVGVASFMWADMNRCVLLRSDAFKVLFGNGSTVPGTVS